MKLVDIFFARQTSLWKIFHQHRILFSSTQGGLSIKEHLEYGSAFNPKCSYTAEGWGWTKDENTGKPVWITIPEAAIGLAVNLSGVGADQREFPCTTLIGIITSSETHDSNLVNTCFIFKPCRILSVGDGGITMEGMHSLQ